jgi:hypothetical protein
VRFSRWIPALRFAPAGMTRQKTIHIIIAERIG